MECCWLYRPVSRSIKQFFKYFFKIFNLFVERDSDLILSEINSWHSLLTNHFKFDIISSHHRVPQSVKEKLPHFKEQLMTGRKVLQYWSNQGCIDEAKRTRCPLPFRGLSRQRLTRPRLLPVHEGHDPLSMAPQRCVRDYDRLLPALGHRRGRRRPLRGQRSSHEPHCFVLQRPPH